ncbi:DUF1236 domain-containing protein [Microvirga arabica]|uniref:DUF1236 domain-containing protein n=1 Tax=Microvirga arabica TaxID=1128671 RepID=UPI00193A4C4D|nr:DUF1236 domain-containing protein [Microvirga arabica]MBM1170000.1 DUF1236 domain-containing protein [Microvirga arabica]
MHKILLSTVAAFAAAVSSSSFAQEAPAAKKQPIPEAASDGAHAKPSGAASQGSAPTKLPQTSGPSADRVQPDSGKANSSAGAPASGSDQKTPTTEAGGERNGSPTEQARRQASEQPSATQAQDAGKANSSDATKKTTASDGEGQGKSRKRAADKNGNGDQKTSPSTSASASDDNGTSGKTKQRMPTSGTARGTSTESNRAGPATTTETTPVETSRSSATTQQKSSNSPQKQDTGADAASSTSIKLSSEEKSRVVQSFTAREVKSVENVSFSISVGVSVPQDLNLRPVPADVVEIVPAYRDYRYVVVKDQIVIVNPKTRKVVEVIERGATTASLGTSQGSGSLSLSQDEETTVIKTLRSDASAVFHEGATVPQCVELRPIPSTVDVPELRSYRYVVVEDSVILVEPDSRRIVKILE